MSTVRNIPKLRFKEFNEEWKSYILDDIATFSKGKGIAKIDINANGKLECIRYGELYTHYKETIDKVISKTDLDESNLVLSEAGDILIPASGESRLDIATASCILKNNVAIGGDLNIIKTIQNGVFLAYYLNNNKKHKIANMSQGVSVVHLYSSQLKLLKLFLPSPTEQKKIVAFLTAIDNKIEQMEQKEKLLKEYKKGVIQKVFNREIRFKKDDGSDFPEWEEKSLSEILQPISREIEKPSKKYLAIGIRSHGKGTFQKENSDPTKIAMEKLFVVKKGDLVVNITFAWEGAIAIVKEEDENGLVSHRFPTYIFKKNQSFADFFKYIIKDKKFRHMLSIISPGGAGRNRVMNKKDFLKRKWMFPSIEEQEKIALFLNSIDKKIVTNEQKLKKLKEFKKGLLQQMFV